jgi:hypothetical protein
MTTTNETLVRLDCIGRIRFSRSQREGLLDAYESSGLSGPQFAAQHGVKYQTFATWLQSRKRARGQYPALAPSAGQAGSAIFAEVERSLPETVTVLEIGLPGGSCLTIRHSSQIALAARLIRELASEPC